MTLELDIPRASLVGDFEYESHVRVGETGFDHLPFHQHRITEVELRGRMMGARRTRDQNGRQHGDREFE
jgi:hypothetical protein